MIIDRNLVIEIDNAKFHFTKPNLRFLLEIEKLKNSSEYIGRVFSTLHKVEGLTDPDGKEFQVEETLYLDLPFEIVQDIIQEWNKAAFGTKEAEEKKEPKTI